MSWQDKLENDKFSIQTGDGKLFFPDWKNASKQREFNSTSFEFIDVDGTYVDRRKPKSAKYDLNIIFQGLECYDLADEFEKSANDSRYWIVNHPIYGNLKGQPISISRSDSDINVTDISIEFWESIITKFVEEKTTIKDDISIKKESLDVDSANNFQLKTLPKPADQNKVRKFIESMNSEYKKFLDDSNYNEYQAVLAKTRDSVDGMIIDSRSLILDVSRTFDSIRNLTNINVIQKFTALSNLFNQLINEFSFENSTDFNRYYIESCGSAIISTMAIVGLNAKKGDYVTRKDVEKIARILDSTYFIYFEKLNIFESLNNRRNNNFNSGFAIQSSLNLIVKKTLYDLFSISFDFKQERIIELGSDSNLIVLTHKYMGLDKNDENIETFRKINNIKNDKVFIVKKGYQIKYYI